MGVVMSESSTERQSIVQGVSHTVLGLLNVVSGWYSAK